MKTKSVIAALMLIVCIFTLLPASVYAETEQFKTIVTGDPTRQLPTKTEIIAKKNAITQFTNIYAANPSVEAPHVAGKLDAKFLQNAEDYFNYVRYVAHLPQVQMTDQMNDASQHGAVLLAAINDLEHKPECPQNMDQAFYETARSATSTSNISYGYKSLSAHIQGCMNDISNLSNLKILPHRRWLLSTQLQKVGFGFAGNEKRQFSVTKVFDKSGKKINYDLIGWPASGNMPSDVFQYNTPWSITVNTERYQRTNSPVVIRVINQSTKEVWTFDKEIAPASARATNAYFQTNSDGYGEFATAYIFRPDISKEFEYYGTYTVELRGWADKKNAKKPLVLTYDVNFFDISGYEPPVITEQPKDSSAWAGRNVTVSIDATGSGLNYHWWIKLPGNTEFVATNVNSKKYTVVATALTDGTQLYCVVTDEKGKELKSQVATIHCIIPSDVPGDLDGEEGVDNKDVEYLLWYTLFPEDYPLVNYGDFDHDGVVDNEDVEYLLWHTLFPEDYPL